MVSTQAARLGQSLLCFEVLDGILQAQRHSIDVFLNLRQKSDEVISEFSPALWNAVVDYAAINEQGGVTFTFRDQMQITV